MRLDVVGVVVWVLAGCESGGTDADAGSDADADVDADADAYADCGDAFFTRRTTRITPSIGRDRRAS